MVAYWERVLNGLVYELYFPEELRGVACASSSLVPGNTGRGLFWRGAAEDEAAYEASRRSGPSVRIRQRKPARPFSHSSAPGQSTTFIQ